MISYNINFVHFYLILIQFFKSIKIFKSYNRIIWKNTLLEYLSCIMDERFLQAFQSIWPTDHHEILLIYPLFPIYSFIDKFTFFLLFLFFFLSGQAITNSAYNVFPRSTYRLNLTRMKFRRVCWRNIRIWFETCWNNGVSVT